ncbi:MAG: toll/interleukin-1 receptor domain-containing protein [Candidatus Competibacteraceae bacterium]
MAVQDFYAPYAATTTALHTALAVPPFSLYLNTGFDPFIGNALTAAGKAPLFDFCHFQQPRIFKPAEAGANHRPVVYNLCGTLEAPDSLVLTENDLLDFLVSVIKGTPPLSPFITSHFSDPGSSFLFIGFGFSHWYVRILLHMLKTYDHRNRLLALEDKSFFVAPDEPETAVFFEQQHCIEFKHLSWQSFAEELRQRYAGFVSSAPRLATTVPIDALRVFLCHSHLDREAVAQLGQQLQALGIGIWLDKQNLRGGDNWEHLIPQVIQKQVDYVLVLQSPNMVGKVESYLYTEISEALERQKRFAKGFLFIIPAQIAPCDLLEQLADRHCLDISTSEGIHKLIDDIRNDWRRRQEQPT